MTLRSALVAHAGLAVLAAALVIDGFVNGQPVSLVSGVIALGCVAYVAGRTRKRLQTGELTLKDDR